jgi:hypothetical protein
MIRYFVALLLIYLARTTTSTACNHGLSPICCNGCVRYVKGFDITGVTNTVQYTFNNDNITNACDCLKKCFEHSETCANWVWKFTDGSGYRTCTLYSNFNLPPSVTIDFNLNTSVNIGVIGGGSPQAGGLVPHCQLFNQNGSPYGSDSECISGPLWALDNNKFLC